MYSHSVYTYGAGTKIKTQNITNTLGMLSFAWPVIPSPKDNQLSF